MSKVKHLLRKLHIGGGGFTDDHHDVDHSHRPVVNSPPTPPPPPSPPIPFDSSFSTSPSSSSALQRTTALVDLADNSNLHSDSIDNSNSNLHADSIDNSNSNSNSNLHADSIDFNILEEEFQVQLALAISVSDHDAREDRESVQINTAKQISLGCSPSETLAEFLSLKYWSYNVLNYDEKVMDGFYDVYGISSNSLAQGKMPLLVDLEAIFVSDYVDYGVILVNRPADLQLRMLEERVYSMYLECRALEECLIMVSLVQKIADLVVDRMGGPVTDTEEMLRKWNNRSCELRSTLNTIILPLGFLDVGLSRHRALLFKVLSDSINLPCKVVKGSYYIDTDEGAVNFVKVGNGSEYIIDLMGAPGTLIPIEVPSSHHQRSGLDTRSMAAVSSTARYSCSVLNNDTGRVATLPDFNGLPGACSSNSKESSFFGTQLSHHVDDHPGNYEHKKTRIINNLENKKESALQLMESTKNLPMACSTNSERIDGVLGGAAEWEVQWEELQIGERIGIGSYGEVFRAECKGTEVAVKKFMNQDISGDALEQFKCEVAIMLRLRHPNVVLFMGAVTHPPNLSILTEFLPRGSLFKLLHRSNIPIDEKRRIRMALDVAKGMNYLHTSHPVIVHRDLKSPNLLVDKNWVVKVCDFGMSRMKHHTFLSSKSTAGTPEWMAPEILRNEPSNEKSDVYSFGVILWELTTLRVPWIEMNSMQVVGAVGYQNRHLNIPAEVDPMVTEIITDCWNPDQHARPSFGKIITRLKCLQQLLVQST